MLEEKKIPYTVEKINMRCYGEKPDSFLAKVPRGLLPVLELDGQVITESSQIMNVLEKEFPENPMLPPAGTPEAKCALNYPNLQLQSDLDATNVSPEGSAGSCVRIAASTKEVTGLSKWQQLARALCMPDCTTAPEIVAKISGNPDAKIEGQMSIMSTLPREHTPSQPVFLISCILYPNAAHSQCGAHT